MKLLDAVHILKHFMSEGQLIVMVEGTRGEEKEFFKNKIIELATLISAMPRSYQTDGQGKKAIVHLHYFLGAAHFYITEKDKDSGLKPIGQQLQAFGVADLYGDGGELGYISIPEIVNAGAELDLHWIPSDLLAIDNRRALDK